MQPQKMPSALNNRDCQQTSLPNDNPHQVFANAAEVHLHATDHTFTYLGGVHNKSSKRTRGRPTITIKYRTKFLIAKYYEITYNLLRKT